jgi:methylase of polypeptide subunit release factors
MSQAAPAWAGSAWQTESTLHQLSPYIGKTKSSMAGALVKQYTKRGETVFDPFSGCGTVAFECWRLGRQVIANDLSPYAYLLTRAKLFPYATLADALQHLERIAAKLESTGSNPDLRLVPRWVRAFFHPDTLREAVMWAEALREGRCWFLLSCLMGILHHQRPGFLSYPSSHTVPYLRVKKFPPKDFPELYEYRPLLARLRAKVERAYSRLPKLDFALSRECSRRRAGELSPSQRVDAIITSPPYMRQLDYGRDNRLRLWFIGVKDWRGLDNRVSPREREFLNLMRKCFKRWREVLKPKGYCVLVVGDASPRADRRDLPAAVARLAKEQGFEAVSERSDAIPNERRVRRGITGSTSETILVLRNAAEGRVARKANAAVQH